MSNKIYNFGDSIKVGKVGEKMIYNYIKDNYKFSSIENVSNVKEYQDKDVDFICSYTNDKIYEIEIKTDTYDSGNLYFETISSIENNTLGCMLKTTAYFLFYYFINTKELYILNMKKYREWVMNNKNTFKKAKVKNKTFNSFGF